MITSAANPKVKSLRELHSRRGREQQKSYLLEGVRLVEEALAAGVVPAAVYLNGPRLNATARGAALLARLQAMRLALEEMSLPALSAAADTETPQGVLAVVPLPPAAGLSSASSLVVVLDALQDPGNLGTILRTAAASGAGAVITSPGCADVFAPKVLRAGMGAHFRLPVLTGVPWPEIRALLSVRAVLLSVVEGGTPYDRVNWSQPTALVIGGEAQGVGVEAQALATEQVSIPMAPGTESLNAAVAAGILLFEARRQRAAS